LEKPSVFTPGIFGDLRPFQILWNITPSGLRATRAGSVKSSGMASGSASGPSPLPDLP
jgi:hypothetical protein